MPTITCTPGGAADNCYVTEAQANARFADTLREATWAGYPVADRQRALIQATREIEDLGGPRTALNSPARPLFPGAPYLATQALHFPRSTDVTSAGAVGVPQAIQNAVCEQAIWLLEQRANAPLVDAQALRREGVASLSLDGVSVTLGAQSRPTHIAPAAWQAARPLVRHSARTVVQ